MARRASNARPGAKGAKAPTGRTWGRALIKGVAAFAVLILFSGLIVYAYNKGKEAGGSTTPPIIKAGPAPYKVRPERPGGMQVLNRDKKIYSQIDGARQPPVVERLLPPAETPMPQTPMPQTPMPQTAAAPEAVPPTAEPPTAMAPTAAPPAAAEKIVAAAPPTPEATEPAEKAPAEKAPAEKPAPNPGEADAAMAERLAKIAPASGGDYRIQLASLRSNVAVSNEWKRMVASNKDLLGALELKIVRRDLGAKGVYFRMQAGPLADAGAARDLCGRLKRRKLNCLVVRP